MQQGKSERPGVYSKTKKKPLKGHIILMDLSLICLFKVFLSYSIFGILRPKHCLGISFSISYIYGIPRSDIFTMDIIFWDINFYCDKVLYLNKCTRKIREIWDNYWWVTAKLVGRSHSYNNCIRIWSYTSIWTFGCRSQVRGQIID